MQKKVTFKVICSENVEPKVMDPNTYIDFIKCLVDVSKAVINDKKRCNKNP